VEVGKTQGKKIKKKRALLPTRSIAESGLYGIHSVEQALTENVQELVLNINK